MNLLNLASSTSWPTVLGVEIGNESLQYVLMHRKAGKSVISSFGRYAYQGAQDPVEGLYEVVPLLFRKNSYLKDAKLIIGIDESLTVVKTESLPVMPEKELKQAIAFAFEKDLAGGDESHAIVIGNYPLGPDPDNKANQLYLAVGMYEEEVNQIVQPFANQGIHPVKVIVRMMALANLAVMLPQGNSNVPIGILNIGPVRSMLAIFRNGRLDFHREIVMGDNDFTKAIIGTIFHEGKAIQFSLEEAEEFKNKFGYPLGFVDSMSFKGAPLNELGAMMRPVVERMTGEIQRSIGFYSDKTKGDSVSALYLVGKGAKIKHLDQVLNSRVGVPVSRVPLPKQITIAGNKIQKNVFKQKFVDHTVSVAVSLETGLTGTLLPDIYRIRFLQSHLKKWGTIAGLTILALLVLITGKAYMWSKTLNGKITEAEKIAMQAETAERRYARGLTQANLLTEEIKSIHKRVDQDEDLLQVLRFFSHKLPVQLLISQFEYKWETARTPAAAAPAKKAKKAKTADEENSDAVKSVRKLVFEGGSTAPASDIKIAVADFLLALQESGYFERIELTDELLQEATEKQNALYWFQAEGELND